MNSLQRLLLSAACYLQLWLGHFCSSEIKVYFSGDTYAKGVWLIFKTSECGISWRDTAADMTLSKVNPYSARNWSEGSTLPVVPLRLLQFNLVRIPLAHRSANSTVTPNFFRIPGLFALITPLALFKICILLLTPLSYRVPIAMSLTFRIRWHPKYLVCLPILKQHHHYGPL